jgi:hypothetical protein
MLSETPISTKGREAWDRCRLGKLGSPRGRDQSQALQEMKKVGQAARPCLPGMRSDPITSMHIAIGLGSFHPETA